MPYPAIDRLLRRTPGITPFLLGVGAATIALSAPATADVVHDGLRAAVAAWPLASPVATVGAYLDGAMFATASVARGLARAAEGQGLELTHQAREMVNDASVWLGLRAPDAQTFFQETLTRSREFADFAKTYAKDRMARPWQLGMDFGTALAAVSGAWEGLKLLRRGMSRIFGRGAADAETPAPTTSITNIEHLEINLSLSGDRAAEVIERLGDLDYDRHGGGAEGCPCQGRDLLELVERATERAGQTSAQLDLFSAVPPVTRKAKNVVEDTEIIAFRPAARSNDWLRDAIRPLPEGLRAVAANSRAMSGRIASAVLPPPTNDNELPCAS